MKYPIINIAPLGDDSSFTEDGSSSSSESSYEEIEVVEEEVMEIEVDDEDNIRCNACGLGASAVPEAWCRVCDVIF